MNKKILAKKENSYASPGSPNPGGWGQYLYFTDGSRVFDPGHIQNDAIASVAAQISGNKDATFVPDAIAIVDGEWVAA